MDDRYLLVRATAVYGAAMILALVAAWRRPDRPLIAGAILAFAWNLVSLFVLHLAAMAMGWWRYDAAGGVLLGMPVDLWLAWAVLWGPAIALLAPRGRLVTIVAGALALDLVAMPAAYPVVRLGPAWLVGEAVALAACLVPGQLLARWTATNTRLHARALLQVIAFSIILSVLLPAIAVEGSGSAWTNPTTYPRWFNGLAVQVLALTAIIGLSAVQEFATRGHGTPVPFDPPRRLVTSGIYAYVANPMQLSALLFLLGAAAMIRNPYVALAAIMSHFYSAGLARWDEGQDLHARFGDAWIRYRARTRTWIPRWRPYDAQEATATLFVADGCAMCQEVAEWFRARHPRGLVFAAAETHPSRLVRITYESRDGTYSTSGILAIARALEHIHFGWAMLGFAMRLPVVCWLIQTIVDASGGGPRRPGEKSVTSGIGRKCCRVSSADALPAARSHTDGVARTRARTVT